MAAAAAPTCSPCSPCPCPPGGSWCSERRKSNPYAFVLIYLFVLFDYEYMYV